ncbi:chemotaxis response regulator containing a CheY-like receiver domain and a methylesterase domain [Desulfosporosinus orientis DSM 765]|uniref:Protein-glutamate methylesterase/protein-glutamine glutaminase n=1 Tax=Desulfosporosinus orientis (strain ATCC 19365 / DSM 765 / NCIMB 8382 / VKM B-1628 / Singapore I) TaxID=768706 RepID=G7WHZ7_DESOD|nr:chemotaxis response regulator protein-glutamate methylesterase [Desulfosporosinus orientis]AET70294.1 chemotaxis response regulator containing a CheY-like receiver domain and a methylesterase domain [Desulfosporosinus orientis DSM 765]
MTSAPKTPIGVLIVDDSPFMRLTIQKILSKDSGIKVLDTARDGREGILKLQALRPQVVTMDVEMPVMNGLQALEEIMRWQPTPVIILSSVTTEGAQATLKAFDLGAVDVVAKPSGSPGADLQVLSRDLIEKIKATVLVDPARLRRKVISHTDTISSITLNSGARASTLNAATPVSTIGTSLQNSRSASSGRGGLLPKHPIEIVAIGTSTGGPSALQAVLPTLPADFPVPVLVAQHMPPGFTAPLAQRLNGLCALNVKEAVHGEPVKAGNVYVAQAGKQLQVQRNSGQLTLHIGEESPIPTLYHPSVDVMFLSLAKVVGRGTLGVVMTGMGNDGTKGMKELKAAEGFAIAESEESCVVYGMPRSIVEAGLADRVVPLGEIGKTIVECVMRRR